MESFDTDDELYPCLDGGHADKGIGHNRRFPLKDTARAFSLNAAYKDNVVKVIIEIHERTKP